MNEVKVNRPTWNDEMTKELAQIVGKQVNEWCQNETDLEDCIETSEKILNWCRNDNGYELAKRFEDEGFSPDSELVDILDSVSHDSHTVRENAVKKWVAKNELELKYEIGQNVLASLVRMGHLECEIVALYPETLQYGLWDKSMSYAKGSGHRIVNEEDIINLID
jgi:hypothetical protein